MDRLPVWRWFLAWTVLDRGGPRRWIVLAAAVVLVLVGQWLKAALSLESLETFAWGVVADFSRIQPFAFIPEFFYQLTACGGRSGCDWTWLLKITRYPVVLYSTFHDLLAGSSDVAGAVLVLSLCVGGITLLELWKRFVKRGGDWNVLDLVGLCVLLPFATSAVALVMQVMTVVLFSLFGALIGIILFLLSTFGWGFSAIAFLREVRGTADNIDKVAGTVIGPAPAPIKDPKG